MHSTTISSTTQEYESSPLSPFGNCKWHNTLTQEFVCITCGDCLICRECIRNIHFTHEVQTITQFAKELKIYSKQGAEKWKRIAQSANKLRTTSSKLKNKISKLWDEQIKFQQEKLMEATSILTSFSDRLNKSFMKLEAQEAKWEKSLTETLEECESQEESLWLNMELSKAMQSGDYEGFVRSNHKIRDNYCLGERLLRELGELEVFVCVDVPDWEERLSGFNAGFQEVVERLEGMYVWSARGRGYSEGDVLTIIQSVNEGGEQIEHIDHIEHIEHIDHIDHIDTKEEREVFIVNTDGKAEEESKHGLYTHTTEKAIYIEDSSERINTPTLPKPKTPKGRKQEESSVQPLHPHPKPPVSKENTKYPHSISQKYLGRGSSRNSKYEISYLSQSSRVSKKGEQIEGKMINSPQSLNTLNLTGGWGGKLSTNTNTSINMNRKTETNRSTHTETNINRNRNTNTNTHTEITEANNNNSYNNNNINSNNNTKSKYYSPRQYIKGGNTTKKRTSENQPSPRNKYITTDLRRPSIDKYLCATPKNPKHQAYSQEISISMSPPNSDYNSNYLPHTHSRNTPNINSDRRSKGLGGPYNTHNTHNTHNAYNTHNTYNTCNNGENTFTRHRSYQHIHHSPYLQTTGFNKGKLLPTTQGVPNLKSPPANCKGVFCKQEEGEGGRRLLGLMREILRAQGLLRGLKVQYIIPRSNILAYAHLLNSVR